MLHQHGRRHCCNDIGIAGLRLTVLARIAAAVIFHHIALTGDDFQSPGNQLLSNHLILAAALVADGNLITEKIDMTSDGQPVDSYDGKSRISTVSNAYRGGTSAILGEGYPRIVDVIIAAAAVLLLAALIAVPLIRHNAKTKALKRRLAEAEKK